MSGTTPTLSQLNDAIEREEDALAQAWSDWTVALPATSEKAAAQDAIEKHERELGCLVLARRDLRMKQEAL